MIWYQYQSKGIQLICRTYISYDRRNNEIHTIAKSLKMGTFQSKIKDVTHQFHNIFWFGDLNYRVDNDVMVSCL